MNAPALKPKAVIVRTGKGFEVEVEIPVRRFLSWVTTEELLAEVERRVAERVQDPERPTLIQ